MRPAGTRAIAGGEPVGAPAGAGFPPATFTRASGAALPASQGLELNNVTLCKNNTAKHTSTLLQG